MISKILDRLKGLDNKIKNIIKYGIYFSLLICIIACSLLFTYHLSITDVNTYYIGLSLVQLSFVFMIEFIICGLAMDTIKKSTI